LHLGHYAGALENWVDLQARYDCCFLIADYQVSDYADDVVRVREAVWEVALDWLAVGLGDVEVKQKLATALNTFLDPIRERRARFAAKMGLVRDALADGTDRARKAARATMALVREALDLGYLEKFRG
jgi:tryptophanyl-tRNA synthetase